MRLFGFNVCHWLKSREWRYVVRWYLEAYTIPVNGNHMRVGCWQGQGGRHPNARGLLSNVASHTTDASDRPGRAFNAVWPSVVNITHHVIAMRNAMLSSNGERCDKEDGLNELG